MKNLRLLATVAVLIVVMLAIGLGHHSKTISNSSCGVYRSDKVVQIGSSKINAEVAKSPAQLQQGLSGRPCIEANQGMLFEFSKPGHYAFWMKDMRFPIDMIWINSTHQAVYIKSNVSPSTYPQTFVSSSPARYVLELQANHSKSLNINLGTPINF